MLEDVNDREKSKSRNKQKKDKEKKKKDKDKDRDRDRDRDRERERDKDKDKERQRQRRKYDGQDRQRSRSHKKKKHSQKQKQYESIYQHQKNKNYNKQRQRQKSRSREKYRQRDRDRQREKQKQRQRDRDRDRDKRQKQRERQKEAQRERQKQRYKEKDKNKNDEIAKDEQLSFGEKPKDRQRQSRQKSVKKKKRRQDSQQRRRGRRQKRSYSQERDRSRDKRYQHYQDRKKKTQYDKHRSRRKKSYSDSQSSSSREGNISDDPEQVQKLAQMKAAKQLVSSKADRKLYLGNLPPNITSQQLMDMLNGALKKMQINTEVQGDSIVSAWISPDGVGHYAFVEFRTAQQATNGLTLNGASLFGYQLKLGRPKQYIEYNKTLLSQLGTDRNVETILKKVAALSMSQLPIVEESIVCPPSKIVVLKYIVSIQQLAIDEEFNQIYEDVNEMAKRFGEVKNIVIPRPHQSINLQQVQTRVKGLGLIFIQYRDIGQAKFARTQFVTKQFSGHPVACSFFDQEKFRKGLYDIQQKVIIQF